MRWKNQKRAALHAGLSEAFIFSQDFVVEEDVCFIID